jgi:hypothetical protein
MKPIVIIESPYAGEIEKNLTYLRACIRDCLLRGEAPFASHAIYTQPGVLRDDVPAERKLGIETGFEFWRYAKKIVFYTDLGWSSGMHAALSWWECAGSHLEKFERSIPGKS